MTQSKLIVFGWTILFSTLSLAAPKSKQGRTVYSPKTGKMESVARHQTAKKFRHSGSHLQAEPETETGVDAVIYKAQKYAGEMTQEVGYLLKATGPWLKEIEDQIRGVETAPAAPSKYGNRKVASVTAPAVVSKPSTVVSMKSRNKPDTSRQLGQMSQSPNKILDTVMAFSKETWAKVHLVVADLMGQSEDVSQ